MKSLFSVVACLAEFGPRETQERSSAATGAGNQKSRRGPNALLHVSWVGCTNGPSLLLLCTLVLASFGTAVLRDVGMKEECGYKASKWVWEEGARNRHTLDLGFDGSYFVHTNLSFTSHAVGMQVK